MCYNNACRRREAAAEENDMDGLPADGAILQSYLNTLLRDRYASLDDLCDDLGCDRAELETRLAVLGLAYDGARNRVE